MRRFESHRKNAVAEALGKAEAQSAQHVLRGIAGDGRIAHLVPELEVIRAHAAPLVRRAVHDRSAAFRDHVAQGVQQSRDFRQTHFHRLGWIAVHRNQRHLKRNLPRGQHVGDARQILGIGLRANILNAHQRARGVRVLDAEYVVQ